MLKVGSAAERAIWGLVRGCIQAGGWQRRLGEAVIDVLRPPPAEPPLPGQTALWVIDGAGLPPRPWRLGADATFDCITLGCEGLQVRVCVARQLATEAQRNHTNPNRGQGSDHPSCDTLKCAQGRGIRAALDPGCRITWKGAGPGGRFAQERHGVQSQISARDRLKSDGLLDSPPSLDEPPAMMER